MYIAQSFSLRIYRLEWFQEKDLWAKALAAQAGTEMESPAPVYKARRAVHACDSNTGALGFPGQPA